MSYTSGVINIPHVTGNIVITATATQASVSSISAVFNQGQNVVYDTDSLDTLKQYLTVTATYADTSTAVVTNYSLSGTLTEGTSTITVTYGGVTDTFTVTVTHATVQYTVTNTLTNCSNSNAATAINEQTSYSGTITASSGYILDTVTVTMGGTDITSTAYTSGTGAISIASVTGNVVITASAIVDVGWRSGVAYDITWSDGHALDTSGAETDNANYSVTDFLPCDGVDCFINYKLYQNYRMYFYDANKTFIETSYLSNVRSQTEITPCFGAKYVRSYATTANKSTATITPYDYPELTESTVWASGQRYTPTYVQGKTISTTTGVESDAGTSSYASGFGLIFGATKGYFSDKESKYWVHFYDGGKSYISNVRGGTNVTEFSVPEGTYYVRFVSTAKKGYYWFE